MNDLSIIIPCYNEEEGLPNLASHLLNLQELFASRDRTLEFVFVNDGSRDQTGPILESMAEQLEFAKVLHHDPNQGLGTALRTGLANATGRYVAALDSDCTYRPHDLLPMLEMAETGYDVVVGSPYAPAGSVEGIPLWALILSQSCSVLYKIVLTSPLHTFTAMFRLYDRERAQQAHFTAPGFLAVSEILIDMLMRGERVAEYPCTLHTREYGTSKRAVPGLIQGHLKFMLKILGHRTGLARVPRWS